MKLNKIVMVLCAIVIFISCGSKKIVSSEGGVISDDATAASVITQHYQKAPDFSTLQAKLRVRYEDEGQTQNLSVSLRMEKDKTIWLSGSLLGITIAKVMITPDRVQYYEKISGVYFDGDFELLSNWLGVPLNFDKVQNLLLGQALYDLRKEKFTSEESARGYKLLPVNEMEELTRLFLISAKNYKIISEQVAQPKENQFATINYPEYQKIGGLLFPNAIEIIASSPQGSNRIDIRFNNLELNGSVSFPFSIPSGFSEISVQ